jgi:hypothetical protein
MKHAVLTMWHGENHALFKRKLINRLPYTFFVLCLTLLDSRKNNEKEYCSYFIGYMTFVHPQTALRMRR